MKRRGNIIVLVATLLGALLVQFFGVASALGAPKADRQVPAWVHSTNAVEFFTNMSSRLLAASGYAFDSANIPVYTNGTFVFTPDVHRILQVSLNLFDATANHHGGATGIDFPTVLRPTFRRQLNGGDADIYISGFTEVSTVTGASDPQLVAPLDLSDPAERALAGSTPSQNIYDVPWLIGMKKGFPIFNEFAMQSVAQVTRKLQLRKLTSASPPMSTNQLFLVGISNVIAVELWNPYPSNYIRGVDVIVANNLTATCNFTNDSVFDPRGGSRMLQLTAANSTNVSAGLWSGYGSDKRSPDAASFVIPLANNIVVLPDSFYRFSLGSNSSPNFTTHSNQGAGLYRGFEQSGQFPIPQFNLTISNRLHLVMLDQDTHRVIDYVSIGGLIGTRDLSAELAGFGETVQYPESGQPISETVLWQTQRIGSDSSIRSPPSGVLNQILVAQGVWRKASLIFPIGPHSE